MRRYVWFLAIALIALLAAIFWFEVKPTDERTQLLMNQGTGTITEGTRLGVTVGDSWNEADAALRGLFTPDYVLWQGFQHPPDGVGSAVIRHPVTVGHSPILVGDAEVSYRDRSWRNGVVTLRLADGVVTAVEWGYGGPFYIDL